MDDKATERSATYVKPRVADYGDLVELTARVGGGLSDVPQGAPIGAGCTVASGPGQNCFSH